MNKKFSWLIQVGLGALFLGLMAWMASRTLHFVEQTVPDDQQFMGYLFLLATGAGSLIWGAVYLGLARGFKQRGIAFALGILDLVGELGLAYADSMYVSASKGLTTAMKPDEMEMFVLLSVGMVFINLVGVYFYHLFDPDAEHEQDAQDLIDEVYADARKQLNIPAVRTQMLADHSATIQGAIMASVAAQIGANVSRMNNAAQLPASSQVIDAKANDVTPTPPPTTTEEKPHPFLVPSDAALPEVGENAAPFRGDGNGKK